MAMISWAWADLPMLEDVFVYNGSGVMPGRTWVIAPDAESLRRRWERLTAERDANEKERLFHPHLRGGKPGDKHANKVVKEGLPGHEHRGVTVANDKGPCVEPVRYGFRSFDRQWIIPDNRLLNQPNRGLWAMHSDEQVYLTAPHDRTPTGGPAVTFTAEIPDLHHYHGRGGRAFPLWGDKAATRSNVKSTLTAFLSESYGREVTGPDVFACLAAVAAHPGYVRRFAGDLTQPGLRIPLTADAALFDEAARLGREVIWLHCFGERFAAPEEGRPPRAPRLPEGEGPRIPKEGAIPTDPEAMPDAISYDPASRRLKIGAGFIDNVPPEVWNYEVSGKQVLVQWFSYRRRNRERPIIGDRRPPSPLGDIQPDHWLAEYTTELLNVLHVLGRLVRLEPAQDALLQRICTGPLISADALRAAGAFDAPPEASGRRSRTVKDERQPDLIERE